MKRKTILLSLLILLPGIMYAQDKIKLEVGGTLRFNYQISTYNKQQQKRGGDIKYDMFAICPRISYKDIYLKGEYRLYEDQYGGGMLRFGYVGYDFSPTSHIHFGLTRVPFGLEPYNSHSYYLGMSYYVGLEDDYDLGLKFIKESDNFDYYLAFFKNSDYGSVVNGNESKRRYSYDIGGFNRETNQLNGKIVFKFGENTKSHLGVSTQVGGLYNTKTEKMGYHYAFAGHYELTSGNFNLKAQFSNYKYQAENEVGKSDEFVEMVAYNLSYNVASEARLYQLGVAYSIPVNKKLLSSMQFYDNFAYLDKQNKNFEYSASNIFGILLVSGKIYTYVECITAKNQPWFGGDWTNSFSTGLANAKWETTFNINVGYYF